ncbi:MAG: 50S ribosomal protein L29 [Gallionellales bacterium CG_4_10_14_3_um_filter_54_96]|nr:50S ribosomal protein L29 [Gallionella sp.]OIO80180.1 MAG: 50S ribosomal protein L29 [Gallionellaceae bacterium CG1_02_56_997]PIV14668.1 MAG: 50S ribosomal protein L29 [Gallionellales bacterium CG03_land_8_20_14_0_80_55_15]PIV91203.1 MAG: 50S ribosomal protein L29 [Gallionellales bacterium CG17_big_fil_post_rev_8_21_14_2_50_54_146]PIX03917.1 MAG: 50S ribosomal protein L29 [Gallionellales bacterium CG_4_8_14_3_um_filter_54_18]PIY06380.1 MAG: 50S ribosomal protein L29 [Gallionellales bacteriu
MKASELKAKSSSELKQELLSLTKAQFGLRMQVATQQLTKTSELRQVRREIARIKTVMTQKEAQ